MNPEPSEKKTATSALTVLLVLLIIGVAIYGYLARSRRNEERANQPLPPTSEDQAERIAKERRP
jgi:hypothetical protein